MTKHHKAIDRRPFQSKADHARVDELKAQYRNLAIPEVIAALRLQKPVEAQPAAKQG